MKLSHTFAFTCLCLFLFSFGSQPETSSPSDFVDGVATAIPADVKTMWYRFSRRADDYCIECSTDGTSFSQMRICHMYAGADVIRVGGVDHAITPYIRNADSGSQEKMETLVMKGLTMIDESGYIAIR